MAKKKTAKVNHTEEVVETVEDAPAVGIDHAVEPDKTISAYINEHPPVYSDSPPLTQEQAKKTHANVAKTLAEQQPAPPKKPRKRTIIVITGE